MTLINNNQTIAWNPFGDQPFTTYTFSTQASGQLSAPQGSTDIHELQQLTSVPFSGDYVMLSDPMRANVDLSKLPNQALRGYSTMIDCVVEIFNSSNNLVWTWDAYSDGHVLPDESEDAMVENYHYTGTNAIDMYHCNSVDVSLGGTNMLVSSRHMDAVFDVTIDPGKQDDKTVKWKLGGNNGVPAGAAHLIPSGDPEGTFSGQHDARIESPTSDQPTEISLYDDHTFSNDVGLKPGGSRGAVYDVNAAAGTATFVKQFPAADTHVAGLATGGFRMYNADTDNLVCWGDRSGGSGFTEYDQNGNVVMNQTYPNGEVNYRVTKVPLSALDLNLLRATAGLPRAHYPSAPAWTPMPSGQLTSGPALTSWSTTRYDIFGRASTASCGMRTGRPPAGAAGSHWAA